MKKFFSEVINKSPKIINNPPLHFTSLYNLPQETIQKRVFHNLSSSPIEEEEYQKMIKNQKKSPLIDITSGNLKQEYIKKKTFLKNGLNTLFCISILFLVDTFINLKYLGPTSFNLALLIITCITISISIILIINIRIEILLDPYGYVIFYLFSIIESIILISLYFLKIINSALVFNSLYLFKNCRDKYICPGPFPYLLLFAFTFIIFFSIFGSIKFTLLLFLEAFKILSMKKKTFFQRQIEINEKNQKKGKIEFIEKNDSINNSKNELKNNDTLKTE